MNIVIKKKEEKTEILNNLKTVHNVVSNVLLDLTNRIPSNASVLTQTFLNSMQDILDSIQDGMKMVDYSIEHGNEIVLSNENSIYLTGVQDYCDLIESKHTAAVFAIEKFKKDMADRPQQSKKRGFWKTLIGLD